MTARRPPPPVRISLTPEDARVTTGERWQADADRACTGLRGRINLDVPPALAGRGLRRWVYACAALATLALAWWLA